MADTVQRRTNSHHEKGKGKSKNRFAATGNKRGFSGGNPPSLKAQKIERSNNRRSISKSKSRSPTRSPAGAGLGLSSSVSATRSRIDAGDIVATSDRLQNQDGTETEENAFKEYLAKQDKQDEYDAEFVFSDSDGKERETTHDEDDTDNESDTGTVQIPSPPNSDTASDVESVDHQNQQDGPTGQGRK